jgi:hypothetical protein
MIDPKTMRRAIPALAVVLLAVASPALAQPLTLTQRVELPSVQGRIDHMDIDVDGNRLFVAALGAGSIEVVDLRAGKRIERITALQEPQGVVYAAAAHRLFIASGASGDVRAFGDGKPPPVATAKGLDDADNLRFDGTTGQLYVGYGHALAILDTDLRRVERVGLSGHPEAFEFERAGSHLYVNVPSAGHIAVVDRSTARLIATWRLGSASGNFPMALDEPKHRLFIATRKPARLLVYDTTTGKRSAELPVCGDADDLFHDGQRRRLYLVCGEGVVDVIDQRDTDRYTVSQQVKTSVGARTGLFAPRLSTLFVAVPSHAESPAEIRAYRVE